MSGPDLGKQIGPLPLGAWIAVVGVGLGFAYYTRGSTGTPATDTSTDPLQSDGNTLTGADAVGVGVNGQWVDATPPTTSAANPPTDNDEWGRRAINGLIALGIDPGLAQAAITNALQGNAMSVQQYAIWQMALLRFLAPPYAVDVAPPVSVPGPIGGGGGGGGGGNPKPKTRKGGRWYLVTTGRGNLRLLSQHYYGSPSHADDIYQANRKGVTRPNGTKGWLTSSSAKLQKGRYLWIPALYV